jgi:hypothetical protein
VVDSETRNNSLMCLATIRRASEMGDCPTRRISHSEEALLLEIFGDLEIGGTDSAKLDEFISKAIGALPRGWQRVAN